MKATLTWTPSDSDLLVRSSSCSLGDFDISNRLPGMYWRHLWTFAMWNLKQPWKVQRFNDETLRFNKTFCREPVQNSKVKDHKKLSMILYRCFKAPTNIYTKCVQRIIRKKHKLNPLKPTKLRDHWPSFSFLYLFVEILELLPRYLSRETLHLQPLEMELKIERHPSSHAGRCHLAVAMSSNGSAIPMKTHAKTVVGL